MTRPPSNDAASFFLEPEGARMAALLLHGFTGHPGETRYVAEKLAAGGFSTSSPRLPGHGTDAADFVRSGARDWIRRAVDAGADLVARHGREATGVVGHSMGGAIACVVAAELGLDRVVLFAPALEISIRGIRWMRLVSAFAPVIRDATREEHADAASRFLFEQYRKDARPAMLAELWRVRNEAVAALPRMEADVLAIGAELDDVVRRSSLRTLETSATRSRTLCLELPGCGHAFPFAHGRRDAAALAASWLSGDFARAKELAAEISARERS